MRALSARRLIHLLSLFAMARQRGVRDASPCIRHVRRPPSLESYPVQSGVDCLVRFDRRKPAWRDALGTRHELRFLP